MINKARRMVEEIKKVCPYNFCVDLFEKVDASDQPKTMVQQGKMIRSCLDEMNAQLGTQMSQQVMHACGRRCLSKASIQKAKDVYQLVNGDMRRFLNLLNINGIGGGRLHLEDGKLMAVYIDCYCSIPRAVGGIAEEYCDCSVGYLELLFTSVIQKEVTVVRKQSFLTGAEECVFEITWEGLSDYE